MQFFHSIILGAVLAACTARIQAFAPAGTTPSPFRTQLNTRSSLNMEPQDILSSLFAGDEGLTESVIGARREFFLWFVGASGGAGIARSQFPKMYNNVKNVNALRDEGPTLGGETIGLNPLCGYPRDIASSDLLKVINNPKSIERIVTDGPKENYLAQRGYLCYDAFVAGNPGCNPLTLRAVFDTFATSTNVVAPDTAQRLLDEYKKDPSTFKNALLESKLKSFAAIGTLLFLLGLADVLAFNGAYRGWFPEWPGGDHLPAGLIDPGLWTIPQYWI
mmetsp:Transcript_9379/g.13907  ORF Transcript_9379/g.13907 Transcript_9379/m.13907 type:complete len:276 (+) Transcript_9379:122-949(+)